MLSAVGNKIMLRAKNRKPIVQATIEAIEQRTSWRPGKAWRSGDRRYWENSPSPFLSRVHCRNGRWASSPLPSNGNE
jgi:hypothetical protein